MTALAHSPDKVASVLDAVTGRSEDVRQYCTDANFAQLEAWLKDDSVVQVDRAEVILTHIILEKVRFPGITGTRLTEAKAIFEEVFRIHFVEKRADFVARVVDLAAKMKTLLAVVESSPHFYRCISLLTKEDKVKFLRASILHIQPGADNGCANDFLDFVLDFAKDVLQEPELIHLSTNLIGFILRHMKPVWNADLLSRMRYCYQSLYFSPAIDEADRPNVLSLVRRLINTPQIPPSWLLEEELLPRMLYDADTTMERLTFLLLNHADPKKHRKLILLVKMFWQRPNMMAEKQCVLSLSKAQACAKLSLLLHGSKEAFWREVEEQGETNALQQHYRDLDESSETLLKLHCIDHFSAIKHRI